MRLEDSHSLGVKIKVSFFELKHASCSTKIFIYQMFSTLVSCLVKKTINFLPKFETSDTIFYPPNTNVSERTTSSVFKSHIFETFLKNLACNGRVLIKLNTRTACSLLGSSRDSHLFTLTPVRPSSSYGHNGVSECKAFEGFCFDACKNWCIQRSRSRQ